MKNVIPLSNIQEKYGKIMLDGLFIDSIEESAELGEFFAFRRDVMDRAEADAPEHAEYHVEELIEINIPRSTLVKLIGSLMFAGDAYAQALDDIVLRGLANGEPVSKKDAAAACGAALSNLEVNELAAHLNDIRRATPYKPVDVDHGSFADFFEEQDRDDLAFEDLISGLEGQFPEFGSADSE